MSSLAEGRLLEFRSVLGTTLTIAWLGISASAHGQMLDGVISQSQRWGSGWIDLRQVTDFRKGDTLRLVIGGTATKVLLRLKPANADPNEPLGIDNGILTVPTNRVLQHQLQVDHPSVDQISVHGGRSAWDYQLGPDNGPATLQRVDRIE